MTMIIGGCMWLINNRGIFIDRETETCGKWVVGWKRVTGGERERGEGVIRRPVIRVSFLLAVAVDSLWSAAESVSNHWPCLHFQDQ